jgi:DNA-binding response OmpR family regulator
MSLHSLLLSSDEKTIRILRRVLSDLEIEVESCFTAETAVRKITRKRFEAVIVDCLDPAAAEIVLKSAKASPANHRAVAIVLVDSSQGMRSGFDLGGHFVLHKPLHPQRTHSSFRAVRALMKKERRRQMRVPVQMPVECSGLHSSRKYSVKTIDICEGGMAIRFSGRVVNETALHFKLELPGSGEFLELNGELAWEGGREQAGVRFTTVSDEHQLMLRRWIQRQLDDSTEDDPPVACRLADLTLGACYLETESPFPVGTGVAISMTSSDFEMYVAGIVRIMHPEFGMGVVFCQRSQPERDQVRKLIDRLRESGNSAPQLYVEPEFLESPSDRQLSSSGALEATGDFLVDLFRQKSQVPVEVFLAEMRQQRQAASAS